MSATPNLGPLHAAPQAQQARKPLTWEQAQACWPTPVMPLHAMHFVRAIEAAHGIGPANTESGGDRESY